MSTWGLIEQCFKRNAIRDDNYAVRCGKKCCNNAVRKKNPMKWELTNHFSSLVTTTDFFGGFFPENIRKIPTPIIKNIANTS